jgi:LemA protein
VRFEEKIEVMVANAKLTGEQADTLRRSLKNGSTSQAGSVMHAPLPMKIIGLAVVGLAIALVVFATGHQASPEAVQEIQHVAEMINEPGKVGEMSKSTSSVISYVLLGLPVLISLIWFAMGYNGLVSKEEDILISWAQVESNYQRRADLIPNLANTVKTFTNHEANTLTDVARLRSQADTLKAEGEKVKALSQGAATHLNDEAYMDNLAKAQSGIGGQLKNLIATVEAYPALRSSDQFLQLEAELTGTENRINVARMDFNEKVGEFNASIRRLPGNLMASAGNFQRKAYFKADEGTDKAAKVFTPSSPAIPSMPE